MQLRTPGLSVGGRLRRAALVAVGLLELAIGLAVYAYPHAAFEAIGRPLLDPVIARQYGVFLISAALVYAFAAVDPERYRRLVWVGVVQHAAGFVAAILDWRAGALAFAAFAHVALAEVAVGCVLLACVLGDSRGPVAREPRTRADVRLARALNAFAGLELFWMALSTFFVQFGARLLGWKLQDAYTTQQQGIALLAVGLASLAAATDARRFRALVWIPIGSQLLGIANAAIELRLGSIPLLVAIVQWVIQLAIIATLAVFAAQVGRADRTAPLVTTTA